MKFCQCGDRVSKSRAKYGYMPEVVARLTIARKSHCEECAIEIAVGELGEAGSKKLDTVQTAGGGRRVIRSTRGLS